MADDQKDNRLKSFTGMLQHEQIYTKKNEKFEVGQPFAFPG